MSSHPQAHGVAAAAPTPGLIVLREGLCYMVVCVPKETDADDIPELVGPSGSRSGWQLSEDETFADGPSNPCVCDDDPQRMHYLLDC